MAFTLTTAREAAALHGVKFLVYGRAGAGKTRLCLTMPGPILIISAEAGLLSIRNSDVDVALINTVEELEEVFQWVTEHEDAQVYVSICLDSITEIAEQVLSHAKENAKDPRQAYGVLIERMNTVIKGFRDIVGKHVYMAAKMEFDKDDVTGVKSFRAAMPGAKLGQQVPYLFDEVFNLDIGKDEEGEYRFLRTNPTIQIDAKDRSGALEAVEPPDLGAIIEKILAAEPVQEPDEESEAEA